MTITYQALLVSGAHGWHNGTGTITYSFLGDIPSYYDQIDTNGDGIDDAYDIDGHGHTPNYPYELPIATTSVSLSVEERALAERAVAAWNAVANIHLVAGGADGGEAGGPVPGNGHLVGGLGGTAGFGETELYRNDDGYSSYDITSVFSDGINFSGQTYTSIYVNTNGSISFENGISAYTPSSITAGSTPMIAPFWADVDTRTDGEAPESNPVYVDFDSVNKVLTVTWSMVGYYNENADKTNSFQLQLYDRGEGDFDIVFRYQDIEWVTGDASGGTGGLGGTPAHAGFTQGDGSDFYELPQSGDQSSLLQLENTAGNTGVNGLWVFHVRNGTVAGDITFAGGDFSDPNLFGFVSDFPVTLGTPSLNGDVWMNEGNSLQAGASYGDTGWQTYLHELGHALGLHHPNNAAADPRNNNQWTVMSYVPHPGEAGVPDPEAAYPLTPMILDIQAMQTLYGANLTTHTENTNYVSGNNAQFALADGGTIGGRAAIFTIWDAGGIDTINASNQTSSVSINLNPGTFSTIGSVANNIGLAAAVTVGGVVVNYVENAIGGSANDLLVGNAGNDVLDGGTGADLMQGGAGNDTYIVDNAGDIVDETGSDGFDRVQSALSINLADAVHFKGAIEMGVLLGSANVNLTGNGLNNLLVGNAGGNFINGGGGADTMQGGAGNDTYIVDNAGDIVDESVAGSDGFDRVQSALSINLADAAHFKGAIEMAVLTGSANVNLTGNGLNNLLVGNAGNNYINGGAGNDTMQGGAGNDTYVVDSAGDIVDESVAGSNGFDRVQSALSINLADAAHFKGAIEMGVLLGSANVNLTGNGLNNLLVGNAGGNFINGGAGADTMQGGAGNDTYVVDNANDIVDESVAGSNGFDRVQSALSINLADAVHFKGAIEMGVLTGSANVNLTGNGLNNLLVGNAGGNFINGGAGNDAMQGGAGNDTYVVDSAGDVVDESVAGSDGFDRVQSTLSINLSDAAHFKGDIEMGVLTGGSNVNLAGNGLNNLLVDNAGDNFIDGGAGNDSLTGGAGHDTFAFTTALHNTAKCRHHRRLCLGRRHHPTGERHLHGADGDRHARRLRLRHGRSHHARPAYPLRQHQRLAQLRCRRQRLRCRHPLRHTLHPSDHLQRGFRRGVRSASLKHEA